MTHYKVVCVFAIDIKINSHQNECVGCRSNHSSPSEGFCPQLKGYSIVVTKAEESVKFLQDSAHLIIWRQTMLNISLFGQFMKIILIIIISHLRCALL